jgi:hypothetical protein
VAESIISNANQYYPPQDSLRRIPIDKIREQELSQTKGSIIWYPIVKFKNSPAEFPLFWRGTIIEDDTPYILEVHATTNGVSANLSNTGVKLAAGIYTIYWSTKSDSLALVINDSFPSMFSEHKKTTGVFLPMKYDDYSVGALTDDQAKTELDQTDPPKSANVCELWTTYGDISLNMNMYDTFYIHVQPPTSPAIQPVFAEKPVITTQPTDVRVKLGELMTIAVEVSTIIPPAGKLSNVKYMWYKNDTPTSIGGTKTNVTSSTFTQVVSAIRTSFYYCEVTNEASNADGTDKKTAVTYSRAVTTEVYEVTAAENPLIMEQPQPATYMKGSVVVPLSCIARSTDGGSISYQWYYSGIKSTAQGQQIVGASGANYIPSSSFQQEQFYYCEVTNTINPVSGGTLTTKLFSDVVSVNVINASVQRLPEISKQPESGPNNYIEDSTSVPITVVANASDGGTLTYQWFVGSSENDSNKDGMPVSGATKATFSPPTSQPAISFGGKPFIRQFYYCEITNTDPKNPSSFAKIKSNVHETVVTASFNAAAPIIDNSSLSDTAYGTGGQSNALEMAASVTDGGTLSYRWFIWGLNSSEVGIDPRNANGELLPQYRHPAYLKNKDSHGNLADWENNRPKLIAGKFNDLVVAYNDKITQNPKTISNQSPFIFPVTDEALISGDFYYYCEVTNYNFAAKTKEAVSISKVVKVTLRGKIIIANLFGSHAGKNYKFWFEQGYRNTQVNIESGGKTMIMTPKGAIYDWVLPDQRAMRATFFELSCFMDGKTVLSNFLSNMAFIHPYTENSKAPGTGAALHDWTAYPVDPRIWTEKGDMEKEYDAPPLPTRQEDSHRTPDDRPFNV